MSSEGYPEVPSSSSTSEIKREEEREEQEVNTSPSKTFQTKRTTKIPKRGKNRQMEWWETTEDYNPGTSLWRGKIIDIISDEESPPGSDLEEIEAETISQKDASLKVCKCSTYSFMM